MNMQHAKQLYVGGVESTGAQLASYIDSKHPELAFFLKGLGIPDRSKLSELETIIADAGHNTAWQDSIEYLNTLDNFSGAAEAMALGVAYRTLRNEYKSLLGE